MKTLIFTLMPLIIAISLKAQNTDLKLLGENAGTTFTKLIHTKEDNILMLTPGTVAGSTADVLNFLLLNNAGDTLWTTALTDTLGRDVTTFNWSAVQTPDEGFLIASSYRTNLPYPLFDSTEIIVVKLNSSGKLSWTKKINNSDKYWQTITNVIVGKDGYVFFGGASNAFKNKHAFVMKIDPVTGNLIWMKTLGTETVSEGRQREEFVSLFPTRDSGFIACGIDYNYYFGSDLLYVKYNKDGKCLWVKRVRPTYANSTIISGAETADGGFVFCGNAGRGRSLTYQNMILRTDNSGNPFWVKSVVIAGLDAVTASIIANNDNTYTVTGNYKNAEINKKSTGFIMKIDAAGSPVWYNAISSWNIRTKFGVVKRNIYFKDVVRLKDGKYVVGATLGFGSGKGITTVDSVLLVTFGRNGNTCNVPASTGALSTLDYDVIPTTHGTSDVTDFISVENASIFTQQHVLIGSRNACTKPGEEISASLNAGEINNKSIPGLSLKIYPNPVAGKNLTLTINKAGAGNAYLTMHDAKGKVLHTEKIFSGASYLNKIINVANLTPGIYILSVTDGKGKKTVKFIKQ